MQAEMVLEKQLRALQPDLQATGRGCLRVYSQRGPFLSKSSHSFPRIFLITYLQFVFIYLFVGLLLRRGMQPWQVLNLALQIRLQTDRDPPASAFPVLGVKVYTPVSNLFMFWKHGFAIQSRLTQMLSYSFTGLLKAGIIAVCHHAPFIFLSDREKLVFFWFCWFSDKNPLPFPLFCTFVFILPVALTLEFVFSCSTIEFYEGMIH